MQPIANAADCHAAWHLYRASSGQQGSSTAFFLHASSALQRAVCSPQQCFSVASSALEVGKRPGEDPQLMRSVAYSALDLADRAAATAPEACAKLFQQAVHFFRAVKRLAPAEPQSPLDLGMALFLSVRHGGVPEAQHEATLTEAASSIAQAVVGQWQPRFHEVELPAMVALNWVVGFARSRGWEVWPHEVLPEEKAVALKGGEGVKELRIPLMVWLGWDTDKTDIDLHVIEPSGEEVYYGHPRSGSGGYLTKDFTQGYGPEVYFNAVGMPGEYQVSAKYFSNHQHTQATGGTSAVVWWVTNLGEYEKEKMGFRMVRLEQHKQKMEVMRVTVPGCTETKGSKRQRDESTQCFSPTSSLHALTSPYMHFPTAPTYMPLNQGPYTMATGTL